MVVWGNEITRHDFPLLNVSSNLTQYLINKLSLYILRVYVHIVALLTTHNESKRKTCLMIE